MAVVVAGRYNRKKISRLYDFDTTAYNGLSEDWLKNVPVHFFEYDDGTQTHVIWGLTAHILIEVAESALSAKPFFPKHLGRDRPRL